jgi:hypothetical protein
MFKARSRHRLSPPLLQRPRATMALTIAAYGPCHPLASRHSACIWHVAGATPSSPGETGAGLTPLFRLSTHGAESDIRIVTEFRGRGCAIFRSGEQVCGCVSGHMVLRGRGMQAAPEWRELVVAIWVVRAWSRAPAGLPHGHQQDGDPSQIYDRSSPHPGRAACAAETQCRSS